MKNIDPILLAAQLRKQKSGIFSERNRPNDCVRWMEMAITADSGYRPAAITFAMMLLNTALENLARAVEAGELGQPEPTDRTWEPESHWDNHPDWPTEDWKSEVMDGSTRESYLQWVNSQMQQEDSNHE